MLNVHIFFATNYVFKTNPCYFIKTKLPALLLTAIGYIKEKAMTQAQKLHLQKEKTKEGTGADSVQGGAALQDAGGRPW